MTEIALPARPLAADPRPRVGYAMTLAGATLFAVNGVVSKVVLESGFPAQRLAELRTTCACAGIALGLATLSPARLRLTQREVPLLAAYGVVGFALVQWLYFVTIHRLPIGIGLLLEFTAPVLVALWARFGSRAPVRRRVWAALASMLVGLALVAQVWSGVTLDTVGVAAGLGAAVGLAIYFVAGEHGVGRRDPISLVCFALLAASLFWAVVQPWWSFPFGRLAGTTTLHGHLAGASLPVWALCIWIVVLGSILPFTLEMGALRHLPATTVGIVATFEPVAAATVAWLWLGESLDAVQLAGGVVVLAGILLAETAR